MAKSQQDDSKEIKRILQDLFKFVKLTQDTSKEQVRINREMMKVMSVLNAGFAQSAEDAHKLIDSIQEEGFAVTDEFIKKWAKARNATEDDLKEILKRFREIEDVNDDIVESAKDYNQLLNIQYDLLQDSTDLTKQLFKNQQEIAKAVKESKGQAMLLGSSIGDVDAIVAKMVAKKVNLDELFGGMFAGVEDGHQLINQIKDDINSLINNTSGSIIEMKLNFSPLTDDLDKEVGRIFEGIEKEKQARLKGLDDYFSKNTKLQNQLTKQIAIQMSGIDMKFDVDTGNITTSAGQLKKGTLEYQDALDQLTTFSDQNKIGDAVKNQFKEIVELIGLGEERTESQVNKLAELVAPLDMTSKIMLEQFSIRGKDLIELKKQIKGEQHRYAIMGKYLNQLSSAESLVMKLGQGFDYISAVLPSGVGDFLGISKVSLALMEAHKKGVQSFADSLAKGEHHTEALRSYMGQLAPAIQTALNPMTLLVVAGILLAKTLFDVVDKYKSIASETNVSILQAKELLNVQLDTLTSQKNQFATLQDIQDIQAEMIQITGRVFDLSTKGAKELSISLVETGKAFGYGSTEAVKMQKIFENLGADEQLSLNLQQSLGFMSEMAGLSPQIVSQDLVDAAEEVSIYFAGMPEKAARAVLQIRRMGMNLKQAGSIAKEMLNLEGFMTDMYELQAMTGQGIDFSDAFDKGLTGDIEGMTKSIMEQIGTTAEYNKMDYLTRMKIAKTLGMSSEELGKSVKLNEQMAEFTGQMKTDLDANIDRMGDISNLNKDEIRDRLQQLQSTDRLGVAWDKIKGVLLKALIPLAETFADAIDAISPIIDIVVGALKGVAMLMKIITPLVKGLLAPFKFIGDLLSGWTGSLDEAADSAGWFGSTIKGIGSFLDGIGEVVYWIGAGLGTWFAITKFPALLGSVVSWLGSILKFIPGIGTIFGSLTGGIGSMFGSLGKKSEAAVKESTDPIVNMTSKIQTSMVSMIDKIKSSMNDMVSHIKASMGNTGRAITKGLTVSPTEKIMGQIKKDGVSTVTVLASEVEKSSKSMGKSVEVGSEKASKSLKKLKKEGVNIIPTSGISSSFKTIGEIGSKTIAMLAVRSATSWLFARKEGEEQMSGLGASIQPMFEMVAMGGAAMLTTTLQEGIEKVFTKKLEKRMEDGFGNVSGKLKKGFTEAGTAGKGMFSKVITFGKSAFQKLTNIGKSVLPTPVEAAIDKVDPIKSVTEKVMETTKTKTVELPKGSTRGVKETGSIFKTLSDVIKGAWTAIKSTLLDIVKFVGDVLKSITKSIGESIKNLLKGIGDGLSSFKTSAIKGAAALVLVSGALWITSKALENFANVSWESIGKGIITLGALTAAAMALGKVSGQVIIGAAAIALLGASLIPAAFALKMFNDVDWSSLAKAGVALIGLGVAGTVIGGMSVPMLLGAVAVASMGAALIPMTYALEKFNEIGWDSLAKAGVALVGFGLAAAGFGLAAPLILMGAGVLAIASVSLMLFAGSVMAINVSMAGLDIKPIGELTASLMGLTSISISALFGVAGGIMAISAAMAGLSIVGVGSTVSKFFGGDAIKDLERIATLADPLQIVNETICQLSASILELSNVLENAQFDSIKKLNDIDVKPLDQNINQKLNTVQSSSEPSTNYKVAPQQTPVAKVLNPKKESVGQNVKIQSVLTKTQAEKDEEGKDQISTRTQTSTSQENNSYQDIYNRPGMDTKKIEMLLMRLVQLEEMQLQRAGGSIKMNGQKVGEIVKKQFNEK